MHSILHEATSGHRIQNIIDGHRISSGVQHWSILNGWFDDDGGHNMEVERAMNSLDSLFLTSNNTAEQHLSNHTDIMDYLDLAQSTLPVSHQDRRFVKGVTEPAY